MPETPRAPERPEGSETKHKYLENAAVAKFLGKVQENNRIIKRWQPDEEDRRILREGKTRTSTIAE